MGLILTFEVVTGEKLGQKDPFPSLIVLTQELYSKKVTAEMKFSGILEKTISKMFLVSASDGGSLLCF